jgi:predicted transcriptional regulator
MVYNLPEKKRKERRNALELKIDVLECCILPSTRTDIFYSVRLPYTKSMNILNDLINLGLIQPSNNIHSYGVEYLTTTRGGELLRIYSNITNELKEFKEVFEDD